LDGHRPREVDQSYGNFQGRKAEIAPHVPRLREILEGVELELRFRADISSGSRHVVGQLWVHQTEGDPSLPRENGIDVEKPVLWVYYTVEPGRVVLRWLEIADREIPTALAGDG
jgi:hypothetical protein